VYGRRFRGGGGEGEGRNETAGAQIRCYVYQVSRSRVVTASADVNKVSEFEKYHNRGIAYPRRATRVCGRIIYHFATKKKKKHQNEIFFIRNERIVDVLSYICGVMLAILRTRIALACSFEEIKHENLIIIN
jgi:hypothetical protein